MVQICFVRYISKLSYKTYTSIFLFAWLGRALQAVSQQIWETCIVDKIQSEV